MGLTVYGGGGKPEEEKTVTAGTSVIEVNPSSGKVMKKVTVNPTPTESKSVTPTTSELTVTPSEGKHLSQVIVGAVEDVTPEVNAQTPVITQILEGLVGKAQGATITPETVLKGFKGYRGQELVDGVYVPHGAYVWKKYTLTYSETSRANAGEETIPDIGSLHTAIKVYMAQSYTFDESTGLFTLVNPTMTTLAYGGGGYVFNGKYYFIVNDSTGDKMFESANTSNSNYQTKIYNMNSRVYLKAGSTSYSFYVYSNTANKTDFVDYVVSDSSTAYPDGGEQGGYWYEKVVDGVDLLSATGCMKIAIDKLTFSSITSYSQELSHSLSEIPKVVFIIRNGVSTTNNHINMIAYIVGTATTSSATATLLYVDNSSTAGAGVQSNGMRLTASTIKLNEIGSFYFSEGVEYTVITMA